MVIYLSGTGNSEYAAKMLGKELQDETLNLFHKIRGREVTEIRSGSPWVVVSPTYAWRIPRILQEWLSKTVLTGSREIYFVMTCGGSIGNAGAYLKKLCSSKGLNYMGCACVVMPENYIALFTAPAKTEALEIISRAEDKLAEAALQIKKKEPFQQPAITIKDRINSGIVNDLYYPVYVHAKKFHAAEACISCGKCEEVCPLKNITLSQGKPVWGPHCTHCMACISHCPVHAIEYGEHTKGLERYLCPKSL